MPVYHRKWRVRSAAVAIALAAAACRPVPREEAPEQNDAQQPSAIPALPVAEPPMDREALLIAVARAASAAALGSNTPDAQRDLDGKTFELRIRFGCAAGQVPAGPDPSYSVKFDEKKRTLRLHAAPDMKLEPDRIAALGGPNVEEAEGFWLQRPWLLTDGCPVELPAQKAGTEEAASPPPGAAPSGPGRIGIAQFFTTTDSRLGRRDNRAYEATKLLSEAEQPSAEGYTLVLSGRLRRLVPGSVISCRPTGADTPPDCIVSASIDRVRIENPQTKDVLAEWGS
jgi:hypothetical protein